MNKIAGIPLPSNQWQRQGHWFLGANVDLLSGGPAGDCHVMMTGDLLNDI